MTELKNLLAAFVEQFPRDLTRTELVKLVFLFEYHFVQLYGKTYTNIQFIRDYYGPYSEQAVTALHALQREGYIQINETPNPMGGITYWHKWTGFLRPSLPPDIDRIMKYVVEKTGRLDLSGIKKLAYGLPVMRKITQLEEKYGIKYYGEVLDMVAEKETTKKVPISRLKQAFKTINRESRGTDEEYRQTISRESESLKVFRERAEKCPV